MPIRCEQIGANTKEGDRKMKRLVIATGNQGKVREIKKIIDGVYDEILSMKEAGIDIGVVEDADSFEGNAKKKAVEISKATDCDVLADDSGLCVDGLDGRPGVYSARYSVEGTDEANNRKLIEEVSKLPESERTARYECVMALARGGRVLHTCVGSCEGIIITMARGTGGFGYDPYFYLPEYDMTFGEMPAEEKNKISHRAIALGEMKKYWHR